MDKPNESNSEEKELMEKEEEFFEGHIDNRSKLQRKSVLMKKTCHVV